MERSEIIPTDSINKQPIDAVAQRLEIISIDVQPYFASPETELDLHGEESSQIKKLLSEHTEINNELEGYNLFTAEPDTGQYQMGTSAWHKVSPTSDNKPYFASNGFAELAMERYRWTGLLLYKLNETYELIYNEHVASMTCVTIFPAFREAQESDIEHVDEDTKFVVVISDGNYQHNIVLIVQPSEEYYKLWGAKDLRGAKEVLQEHEALRIWSVKQYMPYVWENTKATHSPLESGTSFTEQQIEARRWQTVYIPAEH